MMKKFILFTVLFLVQFNLFSQQVLSDPAKKHYYQNPILPGFHPDPSICRAGNDYYLVTSTFEYFPGVPVYHSKDLVNWKLIGHVINRPSMINMDEIKCSNGIFAPTIRYNDGVFYMITTYVGGYGNFVCTATNPAGPWSDPHIIENAPGIDPSLFFDSDGKVYYIGNCHPKTKLWPKDRDIWIQELDINNWKLVGERYVPIKGAEAFIGLTLMGHSQMPNNFEGPHLYKKGGYYYILLSYGGTSHNHAVGVWRSKSIEGPWEMNVKNPIVTHRDFPIDNPIHCTGHADLVETQNGEWWMVLLATRPYGGEFYNLGRETFMVPVDWSGDWPIVSPEEQQGRVRDTHRRPHLPDHPWPNVDDRDDFKSDKLNLHYNFIRTPHGNWWSLNKKEEKLELKLIPEDITQAVNPAFIGHRQQHKNFSAITKMEFNPKAENETAGMVILRDSSYMFRFIYTLIDNNKTIQLIRRATKDGNEQILGQAKVDAKELFLKISALGQEYAFGYSTDGKDWQVIKEDVDGRILSRKWAGGFTGIYVGMYASSNGKKSDNAVKFDWFEYSGF